MKILEAKGGVDENLEALQKLFAWEETTIKKQVQQPCHDKKVTFLLLVKSRPWLCEPASCALAHAGLCRRPTLANKVLLLPLYVLHAMACARLPGSTRLKTTKGATQAALQYLPYLVRLLQLSLWPGAIESISRTAIFNDLQFKVAVRSDGLCILVAGLLDAFVAAFNLRRTPPWSRPQLQRTCAWQNQNDDDPLSGVGSYAPIGVPRAQPRPAQTRELQVTEAPQQISVLPTCRVATRFTGIESPGWRLLTDGGFERIPDGTDAAGWRIAAVSPDNLVQILRGLVDCDLRHPAFFLAPPLAATTPLG